MRIKLYLLIISCIFFSKKSIAQQEIDSNILIGDWKLISCGFVDTQELKQLSAYTDTNKQELLTLNKDSTCRYIIISDDSKSVYSGTWELSENILVLEQAKIEVFIGKKLVYDSIFTTNTTRLDCKIIIVNEDKFYMYGLKSPYEDYTVIKAQSYCCELKRTK